MQVPIVSNTIFRERPHRQLKKAHKKKLTTVVAPAGFGKTVFISQAVRHHNWKPVWYRLTESDQSLAIFLSYLNAGIRKFNPSFGEETQERIDRIRDPKKEWQEVSTMLLRDLEIDVSEDLFFILDDYHSIQASSEINKTLNFLLENLPPHLHIIIISRLEPEISLSRMRVARELIEIKTDDLALTDQETELLCQSLFDVPLDDKNLTHLRQRTNGWIAGLILFYHTVKDKERREIEQQILELKGSSRIIAEYLQENVFEKLPETFRDFLLRSSILPFQEADFCDRYLTIENSREILSKLADNRLFTFILDEDRETYCYHDLFREFLQKKLKQSLGNKAVNQLHIQAADMMTKKGYLQEAMELFLSAKQYDHAGILFEQCINTWMQHSRFYLIGVYADRIPKRYLEKHPWYLRIQASLTAVTFNNLGAQKKLETYLQQRLQTPDKNTRHAQFFLAVLRFELGDYLQAELELESLSGLDELSGPIRYDLRKFQTFVAASLRKVGEADRYFAEYKGLIEQEDMNPDKREMLIFYAQCRRYFILDDYVNTILYGEKLIYHKKAMHFEEKDSIRNCYAFVSYALFHLGRFAEGLEKVEEGLKWIEEAGVKEIMLQEVFFHCLSANLIGLGKIDIGMDFARKGLQYFVEKEYYILQARLHWILSEASLLTDNLPLAEEQIIKAARANPDHHPKRVFYEIYRHHIYLELGNEDHVLEFINKNEKGNLSVANTCEFLLLQAHYFITVNKRPLALQRFQNALTIMEECGIYPGLISSRSWFACLLAETYSQRKLETFIQQMLGQSAGEWRKKALASALKSKEPSVRKAAIQLIEFMPKVPPADLGVFFFGKFKVLQGDRELSGKHWKSRQAKTLFKYLTLRSANGYTKKEILMELLWPDESPKTASKRFHVVLAALRKILEPDIPAGIPSSYILREDGGYSLNLGEKGHTDVNTFNMMIENGLKESDPALALEYYEEAEAIYRGDFLEEDPYEQWCNTERERLKREYLRILIWLMDHHEENNEFDLCIQYGETYLASDPYKEEIYRRLMIYHQNNNMPEQAKQIYARCRKHFEEALDSRLSHKTEQLYREIVTQHLN